MPKKEKEFEVQKIIDKRIKDGEVQYLTVWKGYNEHKATWEPAYFFAHAQKKVVQFQKKWKRKEKIQIRKAKKKEDNKFQNQLFNEEKVSSFEALEALIVGNLRNDYPIAEVLPKNGGLQPKTFQTFLSHPVKELVKVKRYNPLIGKWVDKLQTCAQIIGKNAARELYRTNAHQDLITIVGISKVKERLTVRFEKGGKHYQCELDLLQQICPNQIIDYLLTRYDPSVSKVTEDLLREESPLQADDSDSKS